jgi:ATP-dependent helicase/nuclease subunit A
MPALRHELISASAGSGKTYQLVRRYLHLLALGVDPETIIAMTFTRKAAGEFFNRILTRLARLASGQDNPSEYFKDLSPPVPAGIDFSLHLRHLTRRMHRLRLSTLDSFFASIAACFPLELGLPASASVMDEAAAKSARESTLETLLDELHLAADADTTRLILEAVKQASFGAEQKRTEQLLRDWVSSNHELWNDSPGHSVWGNPAAIWPPGYLAGPAPTADDLLHAAQRLRDLFPATTPSGTKLLDALCIEVPLTQPAAEPPKSVTTFLEKTAEAFPQLSQGLATITWGRKPIEITGQTASSWLRLAHLLLHRELLVRAHRTRGLADFLASYEQRYHQRIRSQGRLSFADIPRLIRGAVAPGAAQWQREDLWFRLDGRFDHWMLDEFQDTSYNQWQVTHRLVDEVLQDHDGRRSFFAVGDIKQSIYVWRQAEPGLFNDLQQLYPECPDGGLHLRTLAISYRSAQPVLDAVNSVFNDSPAIARLLPGATTDWRFEPHHSSDPKLYGYAALLSATKDDDATPDDPDTPAVPPVTRAVAALIQHLDPLQHGLTCAVLMRQNDKAADLTHALRALTGMPVVSESQIQPALDNAPTLALLSLLQFAAHPADTFALEHLRMTPLRPLIENTGRTAATTALQVATLVFEKGFTAFAIQWSERLRTHLPALDAFHLKRLTQFIDLASTFDETGSRDIDLFLQTARDYQLSQPGSRDAIQVMTIHKSKGLEFDIVILAELGGDAMDHVRHRPWIVHRDHGQTQWVLQAPNKLYTGIDETLRRETATATQNAGFESLCRLYVAMTRAKRGLYMIAAPAPAKPEAVKADQFLRLRLGTASPVQPLHLPGATLQVEWQTGDPAWHLPHTRPPVTPIQTAPSWTATTTLLGDRIRQNQPRQRRRTPSGEEAFDVPGKVLFAPGRDTGRHLGSRVHELLAQIDWWSPGADPAPFTDRCTRLGLLPPGDPMAALALDLVLPILNSPAGLAALARPSPNATVWREKPFDFIDDGDWISGVFDRVVLDRDASQRLLAARIIDFKTDTAPDEASLNEKSLGYAPQLALYRRAVARLTGLPEAQITTHLLFLRPRRWIEVG